MQAPDRMRELYRTIDRMDARGMAEFFTEDASFRFANNEPVVGREGIAGLAGAIFSSVRGIAHEILNLWEVPGALLSEGLVTYTRHDGSEIRLPFVTVSEIVEGKIRDYRVYIDATPLHAPG